MIFDLSYSPRSKKAGGPDVSVMLEGSSIYINVLAETNLSQNHLTRKDRGTIQCRGGFYTRPFLRNPTKGGHKTRPY